MRDRYRLDLSDEEFDALAPEPGTFARTTWAELRAGRPLARAVAERDVLAARLAEVEAERDKALRLNTELMEKVILFGETGQRVCVERDVAVCDRNEAIELLRGVYADWKLSDVGEFLARFPVEEDDCPLCHGDDPMCGTCHDEPEGDASHFWELKRAALAEPEVVTCELCDTVQARPECECVHCGAGPKYLTVSPVPVQQEPGTSSEQQEPEGCPKVPPCSSNPLPCTCGFTPAVPSSDELRDRLAQAFYEHESDIERWADVSESCRADYLESADVAIAVLREEGLLP